MKLISKTLFYYLLISFPLLIIAGILSYFLISKELQDGTDEILISEKIKAEKITQNIIDTNIIYLSADSLSNIKIVKGDLLKEGFIDTVIFDQAEEENIKARMLRSYFKANGKTFQITLVKSTLVEEELMEGILMAIALLLGFLVLSFVIVNWILSRILWKPFYNTLTQLNNYEIQNHQLHHFNTEKTIEFNQLNDSLNKLMDKIYSDYVRQKEFTENASHEMQTPLAVIKANLSLLMQSKNLKEDEMNRLHSIENTIKKLSSLNKALILLAKIENNQFIESESVNIKSSVEKITNNFHEVIHSKGLRLELRLENDIIFDMNSTLAEILVTNLLQNAIRHNIENGNILITSKQNKLIFSNTGLPLSIPEDQLFLRFKKNDASRESLGLGLSIVQAIAKLYNIEIEYTFSSSLHQFQLNFN